VAAVRVLDGDLDGAAAAFAEADRLLEEMGSRDDAAQRPLQLANLAARRGDLTAAREYYQAALLAAESEASRLDTAVVSAGYALFEATVGSVELARSLNAAAERGLAMLRPSHPGRHPMVAAVTTAGLMIAVADDDLPLARERATTLYRACAEADEVTLVASVAGALAQLALALGQPDRAARMVGAGTAVRGAADPTDPLIALLRSRLQQVLGEDAYDQAYAAGAELSRAEAFALLDPGTA
jgi:hypothetical protein